MGSWFVDNFSKFFQFRAASTAGNVAQGTYHGNTKKYHVDTMEIPFFSWLGCEKMSNVFPPCLWHRKLKYTPAD